MQIMEWYEIVISILSGLVAVIPLVVKLVEYVQKAAKEKNWQDLLELVTNLMEQAEGKFDNGDDRRDWVLMMVKASADTINYDIDLSVVADMIDSLCAMTKVVNAPKEEVIEEVAE
jgi:hypothetical protein